MKRVLLATVLWMFSTVLAAAYEIGDVVVVIRESEIKVGTKVTDQVYPGFGTEVEAVQGDFLWVNFGNAGWIHKNNVVPLKDAVAYFTRQIRTNPSAELYQARASVWLRQEMYDNALADINEARAMIDLLQKNEYIKAPDVKLLEAARDKAIAAAK